MNGKNLIGIHLFIFFIQIIIPLHNFLVCDLQLQLSPHRFTICVVYDVSILYLRVVIHVLIVLSSNNVPFSNPYQPTRNY